MGEILEYKNDGMPKQAEEPMWVTAKELAYPTNRNIRSIQRRILKNLYTVKKRDDDKLPRGYEYLIMVDNPRIKQKILEYRKKYKTPTVKIALDRLVALHLITKQILHYDIFENQRSEEIELILKIPFDELARLIKKYGKLS